jgi:hypothetical protein
VNWPTPTEVEAWAADRYTMEYWPLAYVLAHMALGDLRAVASFIPWEGDELDPCKSGYSTLRNTLIGIAADEFIWVDNAAPGHLRRALAGGNVTAWGRLRNVSPHDLIERVCWPLLTFGSPLGGDGPAAVYRDELARPEAFWTSLRFPTGEVLALGANDASVTGCTSDLRPPGYGELRRFCKANLQRARDTFVEAPSMNDFCGALVKLAQEDGLLVTVPSVGATLRKPGFDLTPYLWAEYATHQRQGSQNVRVD